MLIMSDKTKRNYCMNNLRNNVENTLSSPLVCLRRI